MIKIPDNVSKFQDETSEIVSNSEYESHSINIFNQIQDYKIESPIEQLLFMALHCESRVLFLGDDDPIEINGKLYLIGLSIIPQFEIGKYRVDFKVSYYQKNGTEQKEKTVLIECDSQQFHDRTEEERRYEKKRDRDLQKLGYEVFRFTGREIVKNPYKIAAEILEYLTGQSQSETIASLENYK